MVWWWWLIACVPERPDHAPDRAHYLQAFEQADLALCKEIGHDLLRGDCVTGVMATAVPSGQEELAWQTCSELGLAVWKEECFFTLAEALPVGHPRRLESCQLSGSLSPACADHIFEVDLAADTTLPRALGEELALEAAVESRIRTYFPKAGPRYRHVRVVRGMAHVLRDRLLAAPLTAADCGALDETACITLLAAHLRDVLVNDGKAPAACVDGQVTVAESRALGAFTWTEDAASMATEAWESACRGEFADSPSRQRRRSGR